ncbi:hypothetical protein CE91St41_39560 [Oscillospiraceae bacterium]|nr:hypothetical protein CE91St40_39530 [Oscillospiraceae bacterium]BDF77067.1 hypothetical protein CE91St41_39560 [Oscillospiraceae bacterium]
METLKNKLCAIGLLACGSVPALVVNDATALVVIGMIAVPLFFAKENWVYSGIGPRQELFPFYICAHFAGSITENDAHERR